MCFNEGLLLRYVSGDFRFRASYSKHNPRKMVKVWAEKERRNLVRLQAAGIRSPQPLQLRSHVLIMDFIGTDGVAAPRLKVPACLPQHHLVAPVASVGAEGSRWSCGEERAASGV